MITHDTPESVYTRKPAILYDGEGYSEYKIIYCDGREIPYHASPAYGGVTLQEVQNIYTQRQNALKKALESDILQYESIDHETFSRDLKKSSQ